jgi:hypothetical protein
MRIAVMQPYFLPFIGYFQLINNVDEFILYDDVNYIKKGWIDRNNICFRGTVSKIKIPIQNVSQNKKINECYISQEGNWRFKLLKTIISYYGKHPNFEIISRNIISIIEKIDFGDKISILNYQLLSAITNYLGISTKISSTSQHYKNDMFLSGQDRIVDICKKANAKAYINPIKGIHLYDNQFFKNNKIELISFDYGVTPYYQLGNEKFVPNLSVLDILMNCDIEEINQKLLVNCNLISN